ncbi:hypothetical protein [Acinetobacter bereziniae]|uniref:hypothetical protein n=1 Tax=Acinetobacter bereziniae TaxID=106648 RepID=UPI0012506604|nr:hypothetical protein [Acinetobacter bereziniae]MCU4320674.1 hypothetical protein [Acinetobacter bereziniae]
MRNEFYNALRRHIEVNAPRTGFGGSLIPYQIGEDELWDASLVSLRVYGTRVHGDVIRLACGVSFVHEKLPQSIVLLPNLNAIVMLQKKYGVSND